MTRMKKKISPQNFEIAGPSILAAGIRMGAVVHIVNITTFQIFVSNNTGYLAVKLHVDL